MVRGITVITAIALLMMLTPSGAQVGDPCMLPIQPVDMACERWTHRFDAQGGSNEVPDALAWSPDGNRLYVLSDEYIGGPSGVARGHLLAFDSATGALLWHADYGHPESAADLSVAPDGSAVYVTGALFRTAAYDAATGEKIWDTQELYPVAGAWHVVAAEDVVLVAGIQTFPYPRATDIRVAALDATDGALVWETLWARDPERKEDLIDFAWDAETDTAFLAVNLFTHWHPTFSLRDISVALVAIDGHDGAVRWTAVRGEDDVFEEQLGVALAATPLGPTLFYSDGDRRDGATVPAEAVVWALDHEGQTRWSRHYGLVHHVFPGAIAYSDTNRALVTAYAELPLFLTSTVVAQGLSAEDGSLLWMQPVANLEPGAAVEAIATDASGDRFFLAGHAPDPLDPEFSLQGWLQVRSAADGGLLLARTQGETGSWERTQHIAVAPDDSAVAIAGKWFDMDDEEPHQDTITHVFDLEVNS